MLVVALAACGSSPSSGAASSTGDAGAEARAATCTAPPGDWQEGRDAPAYCVRDVFGRLQDPDALPIASVNVTVCGGVCFGGTTDAAGRFRIPIDVRLPDGAFALFAHGRPRYASALVPLPTSPAEQLDLGPFIELPLLSNDTMRLPDDGAPGRSVQAGPIALNVPAGTTWDLSFEDLTDDLQGRTFRYAQVAPERAPRFAAGAALVYALAPFDAKPSKPLSVTVTASTGLAPGAAVEFVVMGGVELKSPNGGGLPQVAARGHVSDDGTSVSTDAGQGVSLLTWLAIRPAR